MTAPFDRSLPDVSVNRWIVLNEKYYHLRVIGYNERPRVAEAFFDNFTLRSNPAPEPGGGSPAPVPKAGGSPPGPKPALKPITAPPGWTVYEPAGAGFRPGYAIDNRPSRSPR